MSEKLNRYSSRITEPRSQGASQAMLYGTGLTSEDMQKAEVGISSVWWEGNTCNMHLNDLAAKVKEGVQAAGLVGMRFNTIGVSDGISMGTDGMSYSLQSRDIIADSIETVMNAQWYDANISIPGCDKNMPGVLIAMGRINRPSLMVYGGTIKPGHWKNATLDIVSAFQSYGEYIAGKIDDHDREMIVENSCPGAGACGGMYTANTMASAIEALGMSLPYSSSIPAIDPGKLEECLQAGQAIRLLLEKDIKPRDIMTRAAFENALVIVMALGGSTNAVLHLIAMARAVDVPLGLDDFQKVSDRVRIRHLNRKELASELRLLRDIFNDAWSENWGFVPMTEAEFDEIGKVMTMLLDDDFVQIAEVDGEAAAMLVVLPNINEIIADLDGRLLPFGWLKLLWRLKVRYPTSARIPLMGVRKKFQRSRLGPTLAFMVTDAAVQPVMQRGIREMEMSWILEDNASMRSIIESLSGVAYKTYRLYEKVL